MTVENCIANYKKFVSVGNKVAAENMKQHILKSKKFKGHEFLKELDGKPEEPKIPNSIIEPEVKKSGKKPKG
jgi:hypothetical protein